MTVSQTFNSCAVPATVDPGIPHDWLNVKLELVEVKSCELVPVPVWYSMCHVKVALDENVPDDTVSTHGVDAALIAQFVVAPDPALVSVSVNATDVPTA